MTGKPGDQQYERQARLEKEVGEVRKIYFFPHNVILQAV